MNKRHLKSFLRGSVVSMIGVGSVGIMNYLIRRTLALNLSEIDYGFFYSAFALVMIVMVFLDLGLTQSTVILMSKSFTQKDLESSNKIFTLTFLTKVALAIIFLIILEVLSPTLTKYYFKYSGSYTMLMLIFLVIPGYTIESALGAVINARKAFGTQQIIVNLKTFLILCGAILFVKSYGLQAAILCFVLPSIITIAITFRVIKNHGTTFLPLRNICWNNLRKIISLSSWIAISTAGISVMYYMDTVCLTWLVNLKSVAMYNIALPIMQIAQGFFVFPAIFTPFVSEMWQKKDYKGIKHSCFCATLLMLLTLPFFLLAGIYFAEDIVKLLFDVKYISAAPAVTILWCGMVFFSIASFNINALNSGGKQKNATIIIIVCVIVNLLLNLTLIPKFNYIGAALATAISYLVMALGSVVSLAVILKEK